MPAVYRDVRRCALTAPVVLDYSVFQPFEITVRDVQYAVGNISPAYSQPVTAVAEETYIFLLGGAEL